MAFVEVVNICATQRFYYFGTANTQYYTLCNSGRCLFIIQHMCNGTGKVVVFRKIGGQEIHGNGAENLGPQQHRFYKHRMLIYMYCNTYPTILQVSIKFLLKLNTHCLIVI